MMRGYIFVVNENTLPIHLEYQFVGVWRKRYKYGSARRRITSEKR
jgi:hypothetical protein